MLIHLLTCPPPIRVITDKLQCHTQTQAKESFCPLWKQWQGQKDPRPECQNEPLLLQVTEY